MTVWTEVADGVFRQRYNPLDIGICVVRGADGLLLVDTRSSHREGAQIRSDLTELGGSVRWVVNTHARPMGSNFSRRAIGRPESR